MNLYERWPEANATLGGKATLYEEVKVGAALMHQLILPGQKLAVAKLHTNVPSWGPCPPHETGPCVSMTETKATFAMARTLAQLARVHQREKQPAEAKRAFELARTAFTNARNGAARPAAGSRTSAARAGSTRTTTRGRCGASRASTASRATPAATTSRTTATRRSSRCSWPRRSLGDPGAAALAKEVAAHPRFGEISEFWWYATAATGNLSLLTLRPAGIDVAPIRSEPVPLRRRARSRSRRSATRASRRTRGRPAGTTGDRDELDQNWRWGSSRNLLDDAILLAFAADEKARDGEAKAAAAYAAGAVRVLDWILGTNAMALSMVTGFGENAVERLHDTIVPDGEPGRLALGPNDWTNAGDPDMPPFGSLPGMKMMPVKGRGWAAREIAIDGNAPLVWVAWWAQHRAADLLAR